ncbi:MAG TPA: efflux transporter periplasmic adaptor subunit [Algoriphagus sp.]|jgi:HlyD family secretion protein|uniref:efflux RND transporter periplasmic adaptor subunit n=1 Tax=Algoriphagus TaxID=246875 RepID=UPI000C499A60|nr:MULTISPECIES: efflux RND transporter periplasmic adaptor subunit [Algoriphagus]MAL13579.1 efflux transporter periplasmic adaptor subunit [Algoriphagus sp.]MAN86243.1 efflux transporter periplasmic adaptor subunit [Algoriphagus sp.]QYH38315.1 efflux RND transporter periplasmic adaptor subunit [Algoriphagus sp. NBT04N3]HAH37994.1 efflux transporter periplasmic adaptor subunit [Algoriphagus sp.]HAS60794.1 efflux transporter periplasmic adaptor subunit [Algoriphagus sp.]|tara:strand:+ start:1699 stop:3009 length:1311 start_codon:yes stop_codon:yes gene_type:complete
MANKKSNKLLYYLLGIVGVIIVFAIIGRAAGWIGGEKVTNVEVASVGKNSIIEKVSASGEIQPEIEVNLSPDVAGEIIELNVAEGDSVEIGKLLVKIRPDNFVSALDRSRANLNQQLANLAQAKASLQRAEAQYTRSELEYNRQKKLYEQKAISDSEFEQAQANYITAQKDLEAAKQSVVAAEFVVKSSQATVNEAAENLRLTNVYSPVSGIVSNLLVEKGERVVGTQQMAGTEMLTIADLSRMEVRVDVNENDIVRLSKGDTTIIEVDAYSFSGKKFKGIVTSIANTANTKPSADAVTEFEVKIRILNSSYADLVAAGNKYPFRPGMTAAVEIITNQKENVLSLPLSAVTTREDQLDTLADGSTKMRELVFVMQDGEAKMKTIKTGISDFQNIEVLEGLQEGDQVISGPYFVVSKELKDGDKVSKQEGPKPAVKK